MEIRREPGPAQLRSRHEPLTQRRSAPAEDLAREAERLLSTEHDELEGAARRLLDDVTGPPSALPEPLQDRLAELAREEALPPDLRARAWDAVSASSSLRGALGAALTAAEAAARLAPSPARSSEVARLHGCVSGPDRALPAVHDGLARWPEDPGLLSTAAGLAMDRLDLEESERLLHRAAAVAADDPAVLAARSRLLLLQGSPDRALEVARDMVGVDPVLGRALAAVALAELDRLTDDPGIIDGVLANPPLDPWVLTQFAKVLIRIDRRADTLTVLDRVLQLSPASNDALRTRGYVHALNGDLEPADRDLAAAAERGDDDWLRWVRGEVARLRGDLPRAVELLGSVVDRMPDVEPFLAWALAEQGDREEARRVFERALARDQYDVEALCGLGNLLLDDGHEQDALELFQRARAAAPGQARTHALVGEALRRSGRLPEAVAQFDRALELAPDYAYALGSKGQALVALGDAGGGASCLERAALAAPTTSWVLDELVSVLEQHRPERADALLGRLQREVRDRGADYREILLRRGLLAARQARWVDAERLLAQARRDRPNDLQLAGEHVGALRGLHREPDALAVLEKLPELDEDLRWMRIEILWGLDRMLDAKAELERLRAAGDPRPIVTAALGEIHRALGSRREARDLLTAALEADGDEPYALSCRGALELDDGDPEEARRYLRRALQIEPHDAFALAKLLWVEFDQGNEREVRRLAESAEDDADPAVVGARANALAWLGDYPAAWQLLDNQVAESGEDAALLRSRAWVEVALRQGGRALPSFLAADQLDRSPSGVLSTVEGLLRVDAWSTALERAARATEEENPYAHTAVALLCLHVGDWTGAVDHALLGRDSRRPSSQTAHVAARALLHDGRPLAAVEHARQASSYAPTDRAAMVSLGETLAAAGAHDEAAAVFRRAAAALDRQCFRDGDDLRRLGWTQLRLGLHRQASSSFLQALSITDRTLEALLDLLLASMVEGHVQQSDVLANRALGELAAVEHAGFSGALGAFLHDLASVEELLPEPARPVAERLVSSFGEVLSSRTKDVAEVRRRWPSTPPTDGQPPVSSRGG